MMYAISVLMSFVCIGVFWFAGTPVHARLADQAVTNAQESPRVVRYRSDRYRDPFVPKSVIPSATGSSLQAQDVGRQTVKVLGTISSAEGRWAVVQFENGERLIVKPGQVIAAYSLVVKHVTEQGVTLSAIEEQAKLQAERTYRLDEERDFGEPRPNGDF